MIACSIRQYTVSRQGMTVLCVKEQSMEKHRLRRDTFILRIWWDEDELEWTGQVQHVGSSESALVRSLDKLLAFIEHRTGKLTNTRRKGLQ